ncbi:MAG: selenide, water dikinase SelD [Bacteroidetes bacterium]|nr:selenide, water dikinase SelD [Bacteroidota bacterium]
MKMIYLDYNATTPVDPLVAAEMKPYLEELYGNPSSIHPAGVRAKLAVENARRQVAEFLNAEPDEIIFTSGGTESNNFAIKGIALAGRDRGNHIITSSIEHPSVVEVCRYLEKQGFAVTWLPVDEYGHVNPEDVEKNITGSTILITIMHANNETGTIQRIEEIGTIARRSGIPFHTDAAQSAGKIPVDVQAMKVDLLTLAGHKLYAPKGIGALYIRRGIHPEKLIHGADHEQNLRAGTENVMSVVGLGKACAVAGEKLKPESERQKKLRDHLYDAIRNDLPEIRLNGHPEERLPNTMNISFPGVEASLLLEKMSPVAASAGAACHSASEVISPVLSAMMVLAHFAMGSVRFSIGRMTTQSEIDESIPIIINAYHAVQGFYPPSPISHPTSEIKLTHFTHGLGCACKIRPQYLEKILKDLPLSTDPHVLVGLGTNDDAAVYRINEKTAIVQTVDFFTPVVDDPYDFGAIAAANSLSDIYAMGGKPLFALSIVGFPEKLLPPTVLQQILKGASDKAAEAGISIIGGHTIEDTEPKFGLVVTGSIDPARILLNSGAKPGDALVLTKPLGTGIITTAIKRGVASEDSVTKVVSVMSSLNRKAAEVMKRYPVNGCTDVTGFGLLGHLKEMVTGANVSAEIYCDCIPVIPGAVEYAAAGAIPGGTLNNLDYVKEVVNFGDAVPRQIQLLLADAQTSGGLLISLPSSLADQFLKDLHREGIAEAAIIGKISKGPATILVHPDAERNL